MRSIEQFNQFIKYGITGYHMDDSGNKELLTVEELFDIIEKQKAFEEFTEHNKTEKHTEWNL